MIELKNRKLLIFLILVNIAGFFFGLYYYWYQLTTTPVYFWPFVLDCPLYVTLFALICSLLYLKRPVPNWLTYLTSVGLIKYGLWTSLTVWLYFDYFFAYAPLLYAAIVPLHIGMILEGLVLIPKLLAKIHDFLIILLWLLLNDFLDYFFGTLTLIPQEFVGFLMWESFAVTFLLSLGLYLTRK